MAQTYSCNGTTALKSCEQPRLEVVTGTRAKLQLVPTPLERTPQQNESGQGQRNVPVAAVLNDMQGVAIARCAADRRFALVVGIFSALSLFALSFLPF